MEGIFRGKRVRKQSDGEGGDIYDISSITCHFMIT